MYDADLMILQTLQDDKTRKVFSKVVRNKTVRFTELAPNLGSIAEVSTVLKTLASANLIKEKPSIISSLNSYVITADGLRMARKADIAP